MAQFACCGCDRMLDSSEVSIVFPEGVDADGMDENGEYPDDEITSECPCGDSSVYET